jgi:3-hydroxyisobutyrate dehydrogenase-like beta-hydroxyacid dehydrogenase
MSTVGVVHPGEMGAAVGRVLAAAGHEVVWASERRSAASAARAGGFVDAETLGDLAARCEVVLSICPPDAAVGVARALAGFDGLYVDANAVSPATAAEIAALIGPGYVDGGIIGSPPPSGARLYLCGARAAEAAALFDGAALATAVLDGEFAASALKMVYAAWTKGSAALLLAIEGVATELGVADDLHAEWAHSQPRLEERLGAAQASAASKGWRWSGEMREIAATFAAAGRPDGFHRAAAEVYERG